MIIVTEITNKEVDRLANKAAKNPTKAQKEAGNYRMGRVEIKGFKIAIENPKGSKRYYTNPDGSTGYNTMKHHYGYFEKSMGYDGDAVDVFVGTYLDFDKIFVVDQNNEKGEFDESKVMLGFRSEKEAKEAYFANFSKDWKGFRKITTVSIEDFKKWLYDGKKQRKPFSEYKSLNETIDRVVGNILEAMTFTDDKICHLPYPITLKFSKHASDREQQRNIPIKDIMELCRGAIKSIISDFENGNISDGEAIKIVDLDSCLIVVAHIELAHNGRKIFALKVKTVYVWDGKMNFITGSRDEKIYYVNEPSDEFKAAFDWNQENQDLVGDYTRWKNNVDVDHQNNVADYFYNKEVSKFANDDNTPGLKLRRVKRETDRLNREKMDDYYRQMNPEDYEAIKDYDLKMDYVPLTQKGSANRDLRAMDLLRRRKELAQKRRFYGDKVKDVSDEDLLKYPKVVGKVKLSDADLNKKRFKTQ